MAFMVGLIATFDPNRQALAADERIYMHNIGNEDLWLWR